MKSHGLSQKKQNKNQHFDVINISQTASCIKKLFPSLTTQKIIAKFEFHTNSQMF